jgi:c-di-GMP-binding flagellar brake protein YcgR
MNAPASTELGTSPRRSVRLMVQLAATIDDGKVARMCHTENLSATGMLVRTCAPLPVGTKVDIQFLFRSDPRLLEDALPGGYGFVQGEATVVRHTDPVKETSQGMGLQFTRLEEHGKQLLGKFLQMNNHGGMPGGAAPANA